MATWKKHFLGSGVPLEFAVARIVADAGMAATADFSFLRQDGATVKELSVDLEASFFGPSPNVCKYHINLLIECKYRSADKKFVFFPEPNIEFSPVTLGGTISCIDEFVSFKLTYDEAVEFERKFRFAYKGIEVHEGGAFERDIRHGVNQLRYASPVQLRKSIDFNIFGHPSDTCAILSAKILLTNCELRIIRDDITLVDIENSAGIDDISEKIDRLILYSERGPDFDDHFRRCFVEGAEARMHRAQEIDRDIAISQVVDDFKSAESFIDNLHEGRNYPATRMDNQFFVMTLEALPSFLHELKDLCRRNYQNRPKIKKKKRPLVKTVDGL